MSYFFSTCEQNGIKISKSTTAILYRGESSTKLLRLKQDTFLGNDSIWASDCMIIRDIVKGKYLYEIGRTRDGYKILERSLITVLNQSRDRYFNCTREYIERFIEMKGGIKKYREAIFKLINILPTTQDKNLDIWITEINSQRIFKEKGIEFKVNNDNAGVLISDIFSASESANDNLPFYAGTIHSVKGRTFDAVLVVVGSKPAKGRHYKNLLPNLETLTPEEEEELRIIYVAMSRPRKILMLATPEADIRAWNNIFQ